jgi:sporulation protein YlmC with PRC-barrel domain
MNGKKSWIMAVLVLALAAVLVLAGCESTEQASARGEPSWYWGVAPEETSVAQELPGPQVGTNLYRATDLTGSFLTNPQGEVIGYVSDLVLTSNLDDVSYAAVLAGRQLHAIPWSALRTGPDGGIVADISQQDLLHASGFTAWPTEGNPRWLGSAGRPVQTIGPGVATTGGLSIQDRRVSRVVGMSVTGQEGSKIGTVKDLIVSTDTGAVPYTIVSFGGLLGLGRDYAAVPRSAVDFDLQQRVARVDADRETLQANTFSPGAFPNLSNPAYVRQLSQAYGVEYGAVLGYVPAEEKEQ